VLAAVAAPLLAGRGGDTAVEEAANGGSRRTGAGGHKPQGTKGRKSWRGGRSTEAQEADKRGQWRSPTLGA